jgi:hypothetical protein
MHSPFVCPLGLATHRAIFLCFAWDMKGLKQMLHVPKGATSSNSGTKLIAVFILVKQAIVISI